MEHYKNTQYGYFATTVIAVTLIAILIIYFSLGAIEATPTIILGASFLLLVVVLLSFYKLTITITDTKIEATFGIGLLKRSMKISEIDYSSIQEIKLHWLYVIGIRITPHGWLYNVKMGNAIKITSHANTSFFVGTDDYKNIDSVLQQIRNNQA